MRSNIVRTGLDGFHRSKGNIGKEFGGRGGGEVERGSVEEGVLLAHQVSVNVLEELVKAELANSLSGVTDGGGRPATSEGLDTSLRDGHLKAECVFFVY